MTLTPKVHKYISAAFILACCLFSACKQPTDGSTPTAEFSTSGTTVTVKNLNADSEDRFTLLSLQNQTIVPNSDSATAKWDIGFRKTTIIVNGGKIRTGQGGMQRLTDQTYDALKEAPASGYRTDDAEDNLALTAKSGEGWYLYTVTTIVPIKDVVLVVRTADGAKYAKLEMQSYYKDGVAPSITGQTRYYGFRYQLQTNGTRQFQ
jgi:hypothetical protein